MPPIKKPVATKRYIGKSFASHSSIAGISSEKNDEAIIMPPASANTPLNFLLSLDLKKKTKLAPIVVHKKQNIAPITHCQIGGKPSYISKTPKM